VRGDSPETPTPTRTTYLPALRHSPLSGNSNEAVRIFLYGNRPKWSPFANNFTGEIDTLALKRYCKSLSNPQKASTSNSPRKSTSRRAREAPLAEASRTKFVESPQATAAKGFPVNRRRSTTNAWFRHRPYITRSRLEHHITTITPIITIWTIIIAHRLLQGSPRTSAWHGVR
jgi:hypothetical protein